MHHVEGHCDSLIRRSEEVSCHSDFDWGPTKWVSASFCLFSKLIWIGCGERSKNSFDSGRKQGGLKKKAMAVRIKIGNLLRARMKIGKRGTTERGSRAEVELRNYESVMKYQEGNFRDHVHITDVNVRRVTQLFSLKYFGAHTSFRQLLEIARRDTSQNGTKTVTIPRQFSSRPIWGPIRELSSSLSSLSCPSSWCNKKKSLL